MAQRTVAPAPASYYPLPAAGTPTKPAPRFRRKGLMIAGWTLLGVFYFTTAGVTALMTADLYEGPDANYCFEFMCPGPEPETDPRVRRLYIPLIGPFTAIPVGQKSYGQRFAIALPGLLQLSALAMAIVGTVQFVRDGRAPQRIGADGLRLGKRLRLGAAPTRFLDGGSLTLGGRF